MSNEPQPNAPQPPAPPRPEATPKPREFVKKGTVAVIGGAVSGATRALVTYLLSEA